MEITQETAGVEERDSTLVMDQIEYIVWVCENTYVVQRAA